jgi:uncharacterized membrane protein
VVLFAGLIILVQLRILRYAHMRLGVSPDTALLLLFGSLVGSYFKIPITILQGATRESLIAARKWQACGPVARVATLSDYQ